MLSTNSPQSPLSRISLLPIPIPREKVKFKPGVSSSKEPSRLDTWIEPFWEDWASHYLYRAQDLQIRRYEALNDPTQPKIPSKEMQQMDEALRKYRIHI